MKNKNRIYVTLQYIRGSPDLHWAIVLAPKHESQDPTKEDSRIFHISQSRGWRYEYECQAFNTARSGNFLARVIVAKSKAMDQKSLVEDAKRINRLLCNCIPVPPIQTNRSAEPWASDKVWVYEALKALKKLWFVSEAVDNERVMEKIGELAKRPRATADVKDIPFENMCKG